MNSYINDHLHNDGDELFSKLTTQTKLSGGIGGLHTWIEEPGHAAATDPINNNFTSSARDFNITLKLNGHERFSPQGITYFTRKQIYDHHTGPGSVFDQDAMYVFIHLLLNLKNISHPEHVTFLG